MRGHAIDVAIQVLSVTSPPIMPIQITLLAVMTPSPAPAPTPILLPPVVRLKRAALPTAVFATPVVLRRESHGVILPKFIRGWIKNVG